ncbi:hypothetical protein HOL21_03580 [Candidatus Woesearchaeota archaeon]|jgi:hypothetical protein|nr:hypothetical protein [Candidatus Woesearchaeota archaeon]MBT5397268.1 hypothetical protein [Candidatus Woesearchaeota archaeon]MBT5924253.1 hypothetical protein [Candidatus Woesearchaeota archaeon]MBT6367186.1 hypothetical protein [Candidatus Woesearchaeota archaeon]MBT7762668.1 hypothetical protein [Candidatus Woesearchaeota archaeon]
MANLNIVVTYPDHNGDATSRQFYNEILRNAPDVAVVPILSGSDIKRLLHIQNDTLDKGLHTIVSNEEGVYCKTTAGYEFCRMAFTERIVVRLNPMEHDPRYVPQLAEIVQETRGMALGDFIYEVPCSTDSISESYEMLTISSAQRLKAIHPDVLLPVYVEARKIAEQVFNDNKDDKQIDFDKAMILAAVQQNVPIDVFPIPIRAELGRKKVA